MSNPWRTDIVRPGAGLLLLLATTAGICGTPQDPSVLSAAPLAKEAIETELDVFSVEPTLGGDGGGDRLVKYGSISVGTPRIRRLSTDDHGAGLPQGTRLYAIEQPFTLHPPFKDKLYRSVRFQVTLDDPRVIAVDLLPKTDDSSEKVEQKFELSPQFKFRAVEGSLGKYAYRVKFERPRPGVSVFGIGEDDFYWLYTGGPAEEVQPETKWAVIVLQVPPDAYPVKGTMSYSLQMEYQFLGDWREKQVRTHAYPIHWGLAEIEDKTI